MLILLKQQFLLFFGKTALQAKTIFQLNGKRQSPKLFALRKYMQQKYKRQYILLDRVPGKIKRSRDLRGGRWSWTLNYAQKRS